MSTNPNEDVVTWLTNGPPWMIYRVLVDLLSLSESDHRVMSARQAMLSDPKIQALVAETACWPGSVLKSHNDASHLLHKLVFLAEIGLRADDPGIASLVERILDHRSPEGISQVLVNIKPAYGGTGEDQLAWMLCDAPLVTYALLKMGLEKDSRVQAAAQRLANLMRNNGWPCAVSPELGKFRGPGRRDDPCPFANLAMLKTISQLPGANQELARAGAETLLMLWEQRSQRRPYLFAMGTGFSKLKAPLIWYDLLNMVDVLSSLSWLKTDPRLQEMMKVVQSKADAHGRFTAESIWTAWKHWEFGQKREPSRWITFIALRALNRAALSTSG